MPDRLECWGVPNGECRCHHNHLCLRLQCKPWLQGAEINSTGHDTLQQRRSLAQQARNLPSIAAAAPFHGRRRRPQPLC